MDSSENSEAMNLAGAVGRFDGIMDRMNQVVQNLSTDTTETKEDAMALCGKPWLHGPPNFRCAEMPVPCPPCPRGCCTCGLPRCCETPPFYRTSIYRIAGLMDKCAAQRDDNPYFV